MPAMRLKCGDDDEGQCRWQSTIKMTQKEEKKKDKTVQYQKKEVKKRTKCQSDKKEVKKRKQESQTVTISIKSGNYSIRWIRASDEAINKKGKIDHYAKKHKSIAYNPPQKWHNGRFKSLPNAYSAWNARYVDYTSIVLQIPEIYDKNDHLKGN